MAKKISAGDTRAINADPREVTATNHGDKRGMDISILSEGQYNTLEVVSTTITTTATQINTPESTGNFHLVHKTHGTTVYIDGADVTASSYPLEAYEDLPFKGMSKGDNEIYGIVSSGTATVWAIGVYKE